MDKEDMFHIHIIYMCVCIHVSYIYICVCVYICPHISPIHTVECYSPMKNKAFHLHKGSMNGPGGYAKWNMSDRERPMLYYFTYMWNPKSKTDDQTKQKDAYRYRE